MTRNLQVNFRMPESLKERLEASATAGGRSLTAEVVQRLEQSFANDLSRAPVDGMMQLYFFRNLLRDSDVRLSKLRMELEAKGLSRAARAELIGQVHEETSHKESVNERLRVIEESYSAAVEFMRENTPKA